MANFHDVPFNRDTGYEVQASDWNELAENTVYLKETVDGHASRVQAVEQRTTESGPTAAGNAALNTRLGSGVTTNNTATSQLTSLRNRLGAGVIAENTATDQFETLTEGIGDLHTEVFHEKRGNQSLDSRVSLIEATPPSERIVWITGADFDPNRTGFQMDGNELMQPYQAEGGPSAIQLPNPEKVVTVTAWVSYGAYVPGTGVDLQIRGHVRPEISFDGGQTWQSSDSNPWCGVSIRPGQSTVPERSAVGSTSYSSNNNQQPPSGPIMVALRAVSESAPNGRLSFWRVKLSVAVTEGAIGELIFP